MFLFFAAAIFLSFQISAMDEPICHIATLPLDLQNVISHFLMETEKEFIERTEIMQLFPNRLLTFLRNGCEPGSFSFSPDETKFAIKSSVFPHTKNLLSIIDLLQQKIVYEEECDNNKFAISEQANLIATICKKIVITDNLGKEIPIVKIKKLITKESCEFEIPSFFMPYKIAFNKQGTHIILHGEKRDAIGWFQEPPVYHYEIIPLKITQSKTDHQSKKIAEKLTPLQEYFREKRVCKCIGYMVTEK